MFQSTSVLSQLDLARNACMKTTAMQLCSLKDPHTVPSQKNSWTLLAPASKVTTLLTLLYVAPAPPNPGVPGRENDGSGIEEHETKGPP